MGSLYICRGGGGSIVWFSFVEYKVCEVFGGVLVYFSHESFNGGFGMVRSLSFFNWSS